MTADHRSFFERPEGKAVRAVLERPDLLPQYELLSRIDVPAVQAAVWDLDPLLERMDEPSRELAIASAGTLIGDLLSGKGFRVVRDEGGAQRQGRVKGSRFVSAGTVWEVQPGDDEELIEGMRIAKRAMHTYRHALAELAK